MFSAASLSAGEPTEIAERSETDVNGFGRNYYQQFVICIALRKSTLTKSGRINMWCRYLGCKLQDLRLGICFMFNIPKTTFGYHL